MMDLASLGTKGQMVDMGLQLAKDLYAQHVRDKYVNKAADKYLQALGRNSGDTGYTEAQNVGMRRAQDIARGNVAEAVGNAYGTNAPATAKQVAAVNAASNAYDSTPWSNMMSKMQQSENKNLRNQVSAAEANAGRDLEGVVGAVNNVEKNLGDMASSAALPKQQTGEQAARQSISENAGYHGMPSNLAKYGKKKGWFDDFLSRIR